MICRYGRTPLLSYREEQEVETIMCQDDCAWVTNCTCVLVLELVVGFLVLCCLKEIGISDDRGSRWILDVSVVGSSKSSKCLEQIAHLAPS
jgi:hypothetical protein